MCSNVCSPFSIVVDEKEAIAHRFTRIVKTQEENFGVLVQQPLGIRVKRTTSSRALERTKLSKNVPEPVDNEHNGHPVNRNKAEVVVRTRRALVRHLVLLASSGRPRHDVDLLSNGCYR